jgi:putative MATE family efflux protein
VDSLCTTTHSLWASLWTGDRFVRPPGPSPAQTSSTACGLTEISEVVVHTPVNPGSGSQAREVLHLAVPAFLALVAEPAFLLADAGIVGHLGTVPLAGLGVASAALATAANIFVFLAYGTTAAVARRSGAGDLRGALGLGVDGIWLALLLGALTAAALVPSAPQVVRLFGASPEATEAAVTYLRISALGVPGMLVVLASTGVLRGLQDTRTPLAVAVAGFGANIVLNVVLVYGAGLGIAGSALGTVLAQTGMALTLLAVVVRGVRRTGGHLRSHPVRVVAAARDGAPLLVRTLALRAVLLLTTWVAASGGDVTLASYQVAATVWSTLSFALDALAIAAQALTGAALGAGDVRRARSLTALMVRWGVLGGVVFGTVVVALHRVLPMAFTPEADVRSALASALLVIGLTVPLSGVVFVLDGVLIGAGDGRWLAVAQLVMLAAYVPIALAVRVHGVTPALLWWGMAGFMLVRGAALAWRARGDAWTVVGATR